jgi:hypothetical protein
VEYVNLAKLTSIVHRTIGLAKLQVLRNSSVISDLKSQYARPVRILRKCVAIQIETVETSQINPSATLSCRSADHARVIHRARNSIKATVSADSA